jgi:hypothetical protein
MAGWRSGGLFALRAAGSPATCFMRSRARKATNLPPRLSPRPSLHRRERPLQRGSFVAGRFFRPSRLFLLHPTPAVAPSDPLSTLTPFLHPCALALPSVCLRADVRLCMRLLSSLRWWPVPSGIGSRAGEPCERTCAHVLVWPAELWDCGSVSVECDLATWHYDLLGIWDLVQVPGYLI